MTLLQALGLLVVGTVAGFDLVSGPQILLARPIVAGTLSGLVLGDVSAGMLIGGALELFALEVLPVGATRYPDYGAGTVAATWLSHRIGLEGAGFAVLLALLWSELGGWSLRLNRRANGRALTSAAAQLEQGDPAAASALQLGGIARDLGRSALLTLLALGSAAFLLRSGVIDLAVAPEVWGLVLAAGAAGAIAGAVRMSGRSWRGATLVAALVLGWFLATVATGLPTWEGR